MTDDEWFAALDAALASLTDLDRGALANDVPVCPGWTVRDVLVHTTNIHRWVTATFAVPPGDRVPYEPVDPPEGVDLLAYVDEGGELVRAALHDADLDRPIATWKGPDVGRWWLRRMVHETQVHAWDAHLGAGDPHPIPADVAVDGVDELFDVFFVHRFKPARFEGTGETMHLHATDVEGEWFVRFDPDEIIVTREHAKGDVAARGSASDLLLFLWSRREPDVLETFGDTSILERYQRATRF